MHPAKKFAIITSALLLAGVGAWTYACCANVPWLSDTARSATHSAALSMGLHVFDPEPAADGAPKKETVANLPEGYYLYTGAAPGHAAAKWVVVNPGGAISWINTGSEPATPPATTKNVAFVSQGEWEECKYPFVKWKAKPLPHVNGGIAQLQTTYESGDNNTPGVVKYQLTVLKDPEKHGRQVEMLDKDGFRLHQFAVSDWRDVPGNDDLIQARDSFPLDEDQYRRVKDYTVN